MPSTARTSPLVSRSSRIEATVTSWVSCGSIGTDLTMPIRSSSPPSGRTSRRARTRRRSAPRGPARSRCPGRLRSRARFPFSAFGWYAFKTRLSEHDGAHGGVPSHDLVRWSESTQWWFRFGRSCAQVTRSGPPIGVPFSPRSVGQDEPRLDLRAEAIDLADALRDRARGRSSRPRPPRTPRRGRPSWTGPRSSAFTCTIVLGVPCFVIGIVFSSSGVFVWLMPVRGTPATLPRQATPR